MHEHLTNQQISKKFANQFDLVNYAILLCENMIKSGRAPRVKVDVDNPVVQILAEIEAGKDKLDDIIEIKKEEPIEEEPKLTLSGKEKKQQFSLKNGEKRKTRIMH
jgi:hypothetical protein